MSQQGRASFLKKRSKKLGAGIDKRVFVSRFADVL
jgi:hypothetical protein